MAQLIPDKRRIRFKKCHNIRRTLYHDHSVISTESFNNYKYECSISGLPNIGRTHESSKTKIYIHIIVRKLNTQISTTTTIKQNKQKRTHGTLIGHELPTSRLCQLHFPKITKVILCCVFCYIESDLILTNVGRQ